MKKVKVDKSNEVVRYELSQDGKGLLGYFEDGIYYHIHSNELTPMEKKIRGLLIIEQESLKDLL